jgi:hypothetical protein
MDGAGCARWPTTSAFTRFEASRNLKVVSAGSSPTGGSARSECGQWPESDAGNIASTRTTSKLMQQVQSLVVWHQCLHWGNPALVLPDRKTFSYALTGDTYVEEPSYRHLSARIQFCKVLSLRLLPRFSRYCAPRRGGALRNPPGRHSERSSTTACLDRPAWTRPGSARDGEPDAAVIENAMSPHP